MNNVFKINNEQEWIACQKYLFKKGFVWSTYGTLSISHETYKYPSFYLTVDKYIAWNNTNFYLKSSVEFNKIMREEKLKRILNND